MQMGVVYKQPLIDSFYSALFEVTGLVIALIIIAVFVSLTKRFMRWETDASMTVPPPKGDDTLSDEPPSQYDSGGNGAKYSMPIPLLARLILRRGLAVLWFFDAILQAQPAMVTQGFVGGVLKMAQQNQPPWLYRLMEQGILVWTSHPIAANIAAIYMQAGVGIALFIADPDTHMGRIALWTSMFWAFFIWVFGEGLGGILTGTATYLAGSPGSALFYAGAAILLLLPKQHWLSGRVARLGQVGIGCYWMISAGWQAAPHAAFFQSGNLMPFFSNAASISQPTWLAAPIKVMTALASTHALLLNTAFVAIMGVIGIGMIASHSKTWVAFLAGFWLLFSWWTSMDFGIMGGIGTDPNTPPVVALLMVSTWFMHPAARNATGQTRVSVP